MTRPDGGDLQVVGVEGERDAKVGGEGRDQAVAAGRWGVEEIRVELSIHRYDGRFFIQPSLGLMRTYPGVGPQSRDNPAG